MKAQHSLSNCQKMLQCKILNRKDFSAEALGFYFSLFFNGIKIKVINQHPADTETSSTYVGLSRQLSGRLAKKLKLIF